MHFLLKKKIVFSLKKNTPTPFLYCAVEAKKNIIEVPSVAQVEWSELF